MNGFIIKNKDTGDEESIKYDDADVDDGSDCKAREVHISKCATAKVVKTIKRCLEANNKVCEDNDEKILPK